MTVRVADPHATNHLPETDLLASLGLRPGASDDQIEAAHDEILGYLQKAPGSLRDWVRARVLEVDEAYGVLNGATLGSGGAVVKPATSGRPGVAPASASTPKATVTPAAAPRNGATAQVRVRASVTSGDALAGDLLDGWPDEIDQPQTPANRRAAKAPQPSHGSTPGVVTISRRALRNGGIVGGLVVAAAVVVFGVFQLGGGGLPGINGTPAPSASAVSLDTAAVAADMTKLQANPNDIDSLQDLANQYYAISDYATAQSWLDKILTIDAKNVPALLGYGAAAYNLGDLVTAEAKWKAAIAADPKNIEAHYDLGFLYFSQTPPNIDGVKAEWNAVLALNPDADLKSYIQAHLASLDSLASGQPSDEPSAEPGSSPAGSAAPATSPAPSPAAS